MKLIGGNPTCRLPSNAKLTDNLTEFATGKRPLAQKVRANPRKSLKEPADEIERSIDEDRESDSDKDTVDIMRIDSIRCDAAKNVITPYYEARGALYKTGPRFRDWHTFG